MSGSGPRWALQGKPAIRGTLAECLGASHRKLRGPLNGWKVERAQARALHISRCKHAPCLSEIVVYGRSIYSRFERRASGCIALVARPQGASKGLPGGPVPSETDELL